MDENKDYSELNQVPEEEGYSPRPQWQVWGARIGLVIFLIFVAIQLMQIAGGGL